MTPRTPREPRPFGSIRVLGKKAQELLARTREELQQRRDAATKPSELVADTPGADQPQLFEQRVTIEISTWSVVRTALTILAVVTGTWLVVQLQEPIMLMVLALFVSAIIDPTVRVLEAWRIPRALAVLLHYALAIVVIVSIIISLVPLIGSQLTEMASIVTTQVKTFLDDPQISLPFLSDATNIQLRALLLATFSDLSIDQLAFALQQVGQNLTSAAQGSVVFAATLAGSVVSFVVKTSIVLGLACFIQLERERIRSWVRGFLPMRLRGYLDDKSSAIHLKIGQWARGQIILALCIGFLVFLMLSILGIRYALTLAVLAACTEFIPYVGPLLAAAPAVLVALTEHGPGWALLVAALYYGIQWLENNLLVPTIMKRAVGLSPIAVIFAMLVGVSLPSLFHPLLGILLAVPAATIITLFLEDWREQQRKRNH
jgi:predicted PurR-regulated permease PerM